MTSAGPRPGFARLPCSRTRVLGALALCTTLLAACEEHRRNEDAFAVGLGNPELRHPIGFAARKVTLDVEVPAGAEGLSPNQHVDVYRFLERYKREANGRLVLSVPAAPRQAASIAQSLQDIQRKLVEAGIDYRLMRAAKQPAADVLAIRLVYQHPVTVPPACDKWDENLGRNELRVPYPNFGCSTQHNIAIMVDNARDLQRPQDEDPRSSERRSATWSGYVGASAGEGGSAGGGDAAKKPAAPKK